MAPESEKDSEGGYSSHMKTVAWSILAMGVSLAIVIALWLWFGHIGPSFSTNVLQQQQAKLRNQYGLPPERINPSEAEVPPSLRGLQETSTAASNVTGTNKTAAANSTAVNGTSISNQTASGNTTTSTLSAGGTTNVSITAGSATKTDNTFSPSSITVKVGDTVTWTNKDSTPHTVTSGQSGNPDGKFDSSPGLKSLLSPGQTFTHKFIEAGNYSYYCQIHPNMAGTIRVS